MTATHIIGKDAALEDSIDSMQGKLKKLGFNIIEKSWLNPIANVWSVHIGDADAPMCFTNGKGASEKAALASALGEYFERLSCNYFFADFYLGEDIAKADFVHYPNEKWFAADADITSVLDKDTLKFYNPENELKMTHLIDTNSGNSERGVCCVPYTRVSDNQDIYFPINLIGNLYVSNGMSAGNTKYEARVQSLSELFERSIKFKIIAEGSCLPDVPENVLNRYPAIQAGIQELRDNGYGVLIKDASLGGKYPVMCVTLLNPHDQTCYASFGAHPCFEVALERSLTELLQGRGLNQLDGFSEPGFDLEDIGGVYNLETHFIDSSGMIHWNYLSSVADYEFVDWDFKGNTEQEFKHLCELFHADGKQIYIADYEHLGVYGCRIIIPSVSEIYPPDDLIWDNNNSGIKLRQTILNLPSLNNQAMTTLFKQLDAQAFDEGLPVCAMLGIIADAGSHWADLRVGELKLLLALALKDSDTVLDMCEWIKHFGQTDDKRKVVYHCVAQLLQLDNIDNFHDSLLALYSKNILTQAQQLVQGENVFATLGSPGLQLQGFKAHQSLLAAYAKLQRAKQIVQVF
ncbi:Ribosomal protein S12p methylthiotransferase accessory factor YcaO [hydrothermal vent metagenome]|uniref:Ribosomal protein S12p methylthiotransferase accessory factor YcaO n=1 Tax=hydrothermal vent metagenome TaxID=652676 RepID=A0A3B0V8M1_9ZZZZ